MNHLFAPLSEDEIDELDWFLSHEIESDEAMTLDMLDGYLHAIAIGPVSLQPRQWLPKIWGIDSFMPPMKSMDQLNHILGLVMRQFNGIISGLQADPREVSLIWCTQTYRGKKYDDAESWAYGFVEGIKLCRNDWKPMLDTPEGKAWYQPIGLLGEDNFGPDQHELTRTLPHRDKLAQQIPESVVAIHDYWIPFRQAVYERETAKSMQPKVGRNDSCLCGSGRKFNKCCGLAANLH